MGLMKTLTAEQLKQLNDLKQSGVYTHRHGYGIRTKKEVLWLVLFEYLRMRDARWFKAKFFRKESARFMKKATMVDCPLKGGQLINAIKYGNEKGFLIKVGDKHNIRWFVADDLLDKKQEE